LNHSPATLLGTPVQLLINANILSANHKAATQSQKKKDKISGEWQFCRRKCLVGAVSEVGGE